MPEAAALHRDRSVRALDGRATFWAAMFAASCLGTNLGDFWVDELGLGRVASFASLVLVCAVAILADRHSGRGTEASYWTAIVALRAAATNAADFLTHDLHLSFTGTAAVLAVIALAAGLRTQMAPYGRRSPLVDGWYWAAMFAAGLFGTVAGDLASHTIGLSAAAAALTGLLVSVLLLRGRVTGGTPAYWVAVLAERSRRHAGG